MNVKRGVAGTGKNRYLGVHVEEHPEKFKHGVISESII